ncbi:metallophosphoesterase [Chitinophaga sp. Cy-1792]|uniref:metallophosphoesterase n=1 Tax=Chitinophaga sp. Cy-1792 TaxID=2608339 RepID=UPI001423F188|nr:metallophosphoesterase [Chitinophaga sp. Cy-1792]NIG53885.1 serine/threonine protein phosphatase [Chitinophaga sp. Cy-1792]
MPTRTFVIGDIHGALLALKQLLLSLSLQPSDTLIFLGDYVDGWPDSVETISFLIQLSKKQPCIFLRGNHDLYCEQWLNTGTPDPSWLQNKGHQTLNSYQSFSPDIRRQHLHFFQDLLNFYVDDQHRLFVHGGYVSEQGPVYDNANNLCWDRSLWEQTLAAFKRQEASGPARLRLFSEIYIGHTQTVASGSERPMHLYNLWNVDTGAKSGLSVSALQLEDHSIHQSHHVRWHYPGSAKLKAQPGVVFNLASYLNPR